MTTGFDLTPRPSKRPEIEANMTQLTPEQRLQAIGGFLAILGYAGKQIDQGYSRTMQRLENAESRRSIPET